mgnify:CR=1 FL=1
MGTSRREYASVVVSVNTGSCYTNTVSTAGAMATWVQGIPEPILESSVVLESTGSYTAFVRTHPR